MTTHQGRRAAVDPKGQEPDQGYELLLPLERFNHPHLHCRPTNILPEEADSQMDLILNKACAGLRPDLRATGAQMRRAFTRGRFSKTEGTALAWTISGMRDFLFPTWHSLCALTIFELARGMRTLGEEAGGYAGFLNQWARDPDKPLPSAEGWVLSLKNPAHIPPAAIKMAESDPRREDVAETGLSFLNLDGLRYVLPTERLRRLQQARLSAGQPVGEGG